MIRLAALWLVTVAGLILFMILREERLSMRGMVPLGRLRRLSLQPERRIDPRYRVDWAVRYERSHANGVNASRACDLSKTGVSLVVRERLEPGTEIRLEFAVPSRPLPISAAGRVVWRREVHSVQERLFYIGVRFHNLDPKIAEQLATEVRRGGGVKIPRKP